MHCLPSPAEPQLNLYLSWLWDGKSVLYCAFHGKTEFNLEIILCKPRDCMHSFEFNRILFLSSSRKKTTYECYICSSAKHCCPLSLFTSTPCYHTPTCTKLTCAHVKNKPRKLTPLGLYMLLCASVNPEISFSAHEYMATFATSPTLMTEEALVGSTAVREWELPGRARAVMVSGWLCRWRRWVSGCCSRIWPLCRSSREGVVCYIPLMSFCRQARLWGRLISKYDSETRPYRLQSTGLPPLAYCSTFISWQIMSYSYLDQNVMCYLFPLITPFRFWVSERQQTLFIN